MITTMNVSNSNHHRQFDLSVQNAVVDEYSQLKVEGTQQYSNMEPPALLLARSDASLSTSTIASSCSTSLVEGHPTAEWVEKQRSIRKDRQALSDTTVLTLTTSRSVKAMTTTTTTNNNNNTNNKAPLLSDAIHPQKYSMKTSRRNKTAVATVSGAVIGTLVMPVVGTIVGGAVTGYATNKLHKQAERRAQRQWEKASFEAQARQSAAVNATFV